MVVFKKRSKYSYTIQIGDGLHLLSDAGAVYQEDNTWVATFNVTYFTSEELTTIATFMKELETK